MASIFTRLFSAFGGSPSDKPAPGPTADAQEYEGLKIYATPIKEGSQLRLAGRIEKTVDGEVLERQFIRADMFTSADDAIDFSFRKARQIIDQNGASLFSDGVKSRTV
ncbi:HlyU family transcriptional regulator [Rhizobium halophytocola]|uniref:Transcriptional activator HlyU n=1 Tax=Rhizobium halophytocola TaxID=735519 RepID=A0ABS4DVV9_9HYPH|nr:HlyU family transcriptional regulator [Rhizobium halophytocola]MBP1849819.1 hypothetical protein [Rhizobium halophytocola]